jgi:uncharacterized protein YoxC
VDVTTVVLVTASDILRYAAAFFFVLVAIAMAYALFRAGNVLARADKMLEDVDREAVPLLRKSGETLDGVNGSLSNVDEITRDVADMTDKVNGLVTAAEAAMRAPARKAAAFGSGVQQAVSSFLRRDHGAASAADAAATPGWQAPEPSPTEAPAAEPAAEPDVSEAQSAVPDEESPA